MDRSKRFGKMTGIFEKRFGWLLGFSQKKIWQNDGFFAEKIWLAAKSVLEWICMLPLRELHDLCKAEQFM